MHLKILLTWVHVPNSKKISEMHTRIANEMHIANSIRSFRYHNAPARAISASKFEYSSRVLHFLGYLAPRAKYFARTSTWYIPHACKLSSIYPCKSIQLLVIKELELRQPTLLQGWLLVIKSIQTCLKLHTEILWRAVQRFCPRKKVLGNE